MHSQPSFRIALTFIAAAALAVPATATFHFMQIEQVIGGVNGDASVQAIQLRMRAGFQNLVSNSRVNVRDAAGANPVLIIDMTTNVANALAGDRVLIVSPNFAAYTTPTTVPDFVMTNLIPESYLAAGSLTFEDDFGTILWRLSWGGASYTGAQTGSLDNDADGMFGPAFGSALPSTNLQAVRFTGAAGALSTNNAAQYALSSSPAVFTNNARTAFTVMCPNPSITVQPSPQTVDVGDPVSFTVTATNGALAHQWRRDSMDLLDGGTLSGATTAALSISSVDLADAGSYDVVITNSCGSATSVAVLLTVNAPGCPNSLPQCDNSDIFPAGGGDCVVDISDLGVLLSNFNPAIGGKTRDQGDIFPLLGGDGFVNLSDLGQLLSDFGTDCR